TAPHAEIACGPARNVALGLFAGRTAPDRGTADDGRDARAAETAAPIGCQPVADAGNSRRTRLQVIVVDASAVLELLLQTPAAEAVAERVFELGQSTHAPHLIDIEIA